MKEQFEKNHKIKVIAMGIASLVIIGLSVTLFYVNKNNETDKPKSNNTKNTSSTTSSTTPKKDDTNYVEAISVDNNDYFESECGVSYYVPELIVYEDALYAGIDDKNDLTKNLETIKINNGKGFKLIDNIREAYFVEEGNCGYHFAFASGKDGNFYYINNYKDSKSKMLEVTLIKELKNIKTVESREGEESIDAYAIDEKGKEYNLSKIIETYSKLDLEV